MSQSERLFCDKHKIENEKFLCIKEYLLYKCKQDLVIDPEDYINKMPICKLPLK